MRFPSSSCTTWRRPISVASRSAPNRTCLGPGVGGWVLKGGFGWLGVGVWVLKGGFMWGGFER